MGRLSLRFLSHARPKKTYFSGGKYWGRGLEVRSPPPRGPELFSYNMKWEGESPCFWCRMMTPLQGWVQIRRKRNLESNEERDQPAKNVSKFSELDWPSIFDLPQRLFFFCLFKYEVFDMELIFNYHANKSYFQMKYFALSLILKARVLEIRKWSAYRYRLMFIDLAMYRVSETFKGFITRPFITITKVQA